MSEDRELRSKLHRQMLKIRLTELKIAEIYPTDKIQSPIHLSIGQEAVSAGVALALAATDHLYGTYRGHGLYITRGGSLKKLFAELYGKETGCAKGKGGSMHLIAPEKGLMGCSAIVASTVPVATGDALASQMQGRKRVVASFFGDGVFGAGVFYESANFSVLKNLPVLYVCENNNYAVHSRVEDRHKQTELFRMGEGLGLPGKRFDGTDPFLVYSRVREAAEEIRKGGGPRLLEFMTYRWYEHVGPERDHEEAYRDRAKLDYALENDPLEKSREILEKKFKVSRQEFDLWEEEIRTEIEAAVEFAEESPLPSPEDLREDLYVDTTSWGDRSIGRPVPPGSGTGTGRLISYREALNQALIQAMERDPSVFVMGIGADDHKAIFGSTKDLVERFGEARCFDTPISEAAMTGVAIGAALGGMKPVHVHIRADFLYLALDQLLNLAAKWRYMFGGTMNVPMVVRAVIGRSWGQGAQHSQSLQSFFMQVPGIKVVMPTTPYDAKGLLLSAISDPNPVVMIEHRLLYDIAGGVPENDYKIPFGQAVVRRLGKDVTLVSNSYMVVECLKAAEFLEEQGIDVEIIDPVSLVPLDEETILNSVKKTGRLLVVDCGWTTCGVSAEIAALAAEKAFSELKAPVQRLGNEAVPCPVAKPLENEFYPSAKKIVARVCRMLNRQMPEEEVPVLTTKFKGPF